MDLVKRLDILRREHFIEGGDGDETMREAIAALQPGGEGDLSALDREELELVVRCQAERIEQLQSAPVAVTVDDAMMQRAWTAFRKPNTPDEIAQWGETGAPIRRALSAALAAEVG